MLGAISYKLDAAKLVASDELFKHWFVFVNLNKQVALTSGPSSTSYLNRREANKVEIQLTRQVKIMKIIINTVWLL